MKQKLDKGFHDKLKGGLADKKKPSDFDPAALAKGIKVEREHTNNPQIAEEIAMDHLTEDPKYYDKLEKIEKKGHATNNFWNGFEKQARELTTRARKNLSAGEFVFPKERKYPIHDKNHARNALARVSQFGSPAEQKAVRAAVHAKYPDIGED